jgi:hypothetical protein
MKVLSSINLNKLVVPPTNVYIYKFIDNLKTY